MSFNVRFDDQSQGAHSWENRRASVIGLIRSGASDIVALQEPVAGQVADIQEALSDIYTGITVGRDDGEQGGLHVTILFQKNKFLCENQGVFWLSETPDSPGSIGWDADQTRVAIWASLRKIDADWRITICNTHLDHLGAEARARGAELLAGRMSAVVRGKPLVVTGDFNAEVTSRPYLVMTSHFLDAGCAEERKPTFRGFTGDGDLLGGPKVIDYIFFSRSLRLGDFRLLDRRREDGSYPSDHVPLLASFEDHVLDLG